jgi:hypothetical protein
MGTRPGWETFYKEGIAYHARMVQGAGRGSLSAEVIHGLASLAIEKFLMALIVHNGSMPEGHTFPDLLRSSKSYAVFDPDIEDALILMDEIQPLCTMEPVPVKPVRRSDIGTFINASENIKRVVDNLLPLGEIQ